MNNIEKLIEIWDNAATRFFITILGYCRVVLL